MKPSRITKMQNSTPASAPRAIKSGFQEISRSAISLGVRSGRCFLSMSTMAVAAHALFSSIGCDPKLRQSLPLAVAPALMLALLAPFNLIFALPAASWMAICTGYGLLLGARERSACVAMSGPAAMVMHFGWSVGFLREAIRHIARQQAGGSTAQSKPASIALQRGRITS